ncbi:hypothetical protein D3C87_1719670 [compost metagenome]
MKISVSSGFITPRNASKVSTRLNAARIISPNATRMSRPLPSDAVIANRCCQSTRLNAVNNKALAISVTHSGRTALIFNMMIG